MINLKQPIISSKPFLIILISLGVAVGFISCNKDEIIVVPEEEEEIKVDPIEIGDYFLLPESIEQLPYLEKEFVTFVDSFGNEVVFEIEEKELELRGPATLFRYDVYEEGDVIEYNFRNQRKEIILSNESLNLTFKIVLRAYPFYGDPESLAIADIRYSMDFFD